MRSIFGRPRFWGFEAETRASSLALPGYGFRLPPGRVPSGRPLATPKEILSFLWNITANGRGNQVCELALYRFTAPAALGLLEVGADTKEFAVVLRNWSKLALDFTGNSLA
jgi:hypothetical protein